MISRRLAVAIGLLCTSVAHAEFAFKPYGYLQYDVNRVDESETLALASDIRRLRIGLNLTFSAAFDAKVEYDLNSNLATDAYLRWRNGGHSVLVGHLKPPFSLEQLSSNRNVMFIERSLADALSLARRRGVNYGYGDGPWLLQLGAYDGNAAGLLEGDGWVTRAVFAPKTDSGVLHFAIAAGREKPASDFRFSSRGETASFMPTRIDTGRLRDVSDVSRLGLEALWIRGPWAVQSEWITARIDRASTDADVTGAYLQASWMLSGTRVYKDGMLNAPDAGEDGRAFEIAARASRLDLTDAGIAGGDLTNLSLGATWYLAPNTRLMVNYVRSDGERGSRDIDPNILEARIQLSL